MTRLFSPGRIGPVEIRNRIVMPSMTTRLADAEGRVTDATIAYYRARAAGGVGLITAEMASPEPVGRHRLAKIDAGNLGTEMRMKWLDTNAHGEPLPGNHARARRGLHCSAAR